MTDWRIQRNAINTAVKRKWRRVQGSPFIAALRLRHVYVGFIIVAVCATVGLNLLALRRGGFTTEDDAKFLRPMTEESARCPPSYEWNGNITEFPQFMLRWPTDKFEAGECDIWNRTIKHVYNVTHHPRTYDRRKVFDVEFGNLTEAWDNNGTMTIHSNASSAKENATRKLEIAACSLSNYQFIEHFPHQMQHIFPCWSFWRHFPDAQHLLLLRPRFHRHFLYASDFSKGMTKVLEANNIELRPANVLKFQYAHDSDASRLLIVCGRRKDGFQMVADGDMEALRRTTLSVHGLDRYADQFCGAPAHAQYEGRPPRIAIANRKKTRQLLGAHDVAAHLQEQLALPYRPPVFFFENMPFEKQVEAYNNVDILLSPHGAALTGIPFMSPCSAVIEVFPFGYGRDKYYGRLSALAGVNHSYIYLGEHMKEETEQMDTREGHQATRDPSLCAPGHRMAEAVRIQVDRWKQCCGCNEEVANPLGIK